MSKAIHQENVPKQPFLGDARGVEIQWLIHDPDGADKFHMRRIIIQPNGYTPKHSHPYEHEVYVLSGRGQVLIDKDWFDFEKDYAIFIKPNVLHQVKNAGDEELIL